MSRYAVFDKTGKELWRTETLHGALIWLKAVGSGSYIREVILGEPITLEEIKAFWERSGG